MAYCVAGRNRRGTPLLRAGDELMGFVSHGLIAIAVVGIFAWMWRSSRSEKAKPESGRMLFPAALAIRIFVSTFGVVLAFLVVLTTYRHRPDEWWVPFAFLGLFALVP